MKRLYGFSPENGAGIVAKNVVLQLDGVKLVDNASEQHGGGIYADDSRVWLEDVSVERNSADFGGGVYEAGQGSLANTSFRFNQARDYSGAIFVANSAELNLYASTTIRNRAEEAGDTLSDGGAFANFGTLRLDDVVTQGDAANHGGTLYNEGTAVITDSTITSGSGFTRTANPQLGPLQNNGGVHPSYLPAQSSPAVDVGNPLHCLTVERQTSVPKAIGLGFSGVAVSAEITPLVWLLPLLFITRIALANKSRL